jgi:hypothetical protein
VRDQYAAYEGSEKTYEFDDPVKVLETFFLEHSRVHIVLEVAVVDLSPFYQPYRSGKGSTRTYR